MNKRLVYDLPTRLFHWIFAVGFLSSFVIGKTVDDDSQIFAYHMLIGISLVVLTIARILWGLIGSKHARFASFPLNPRKLINYLKGILTGDKTRWAGHNPASSWAAAIMILLTIGLGATGYLMTNGVNKHFFEEVHELFANSFILLVIFHVVGIALHSVRHNEMIALSMVDGKKGNINETEQIPNSHPLMALALLFLVLFTGSYLVKGFNSQTGELKIAGYTWQLGESEDGESEQNREFDRKTQNMSDEDDDD